MTMLDHALELAVQGFRVFPLQPNSKLPRRKGWTADASSDLEQVLAWWQESPDANIGVLTTGLVVVDLDVKHGVDGGASYLEAGGTLNTYTVATPTGGLHLYFTGPRVSIAAGVLPGVDIRGDNGYVVGPGSVINGKEYEVVHSTTINRVPGCIESILNRPAPKTPPAKQDIGPIDISRAYLLADQWLATLPPVHQGQRNAELYKIAARLMRDFALPADWAKEALADWNSRSCFPPVEDSEIDHLVRSASRYATAAPGSAIPEGVIGDLDPKTLPGCTPKKLPPGVPPANVCYFGNAISPDKLEARPWLSPGFLLRRSLTMVSAAGSAGKTNYAMLTAIHAATGSPMGRDQFVKPSKVIYYGGEDDISEFSRRLAAHCQKENLDFNEIKSQIMLCDSSILKLVMSEQSDSDPLSPVTPIRSDFMYMEGKNPVINTVAVDWLVETAKSEEVGLLILDPLVELHSLEENSTAHMRMVMSLLRDIAQRANIAVMVMHHTSKGSSGNADSARGSSAISNAVRIHRDIWVMKSEECDLYGLPPGSENDYIVVADVKANLAKKGVNQILHRASVTLDNGDVVGILAPIGLCPDAQILTANIATHLAERARSLGAGGVTMSEAISIARQFPTFAESTDAAIKAQLTRKFKQRVKIPNTDEFMVKCEWAALNKSSLAFVLIGPNSGIDDLSQLTGV